MGHLTLLVHVRLSVQFALLSKAGLVRHAHAAAPSQIARDSVIAEFMRRREKGKEED